MQFSLQRLLLKSGHAVVCQPRYRDVGFCACAGRGVQDAVSAVLAALASVTSTCYGFRQPHPGSGMPGKRCQLFGTAFEYFENIFFALILHCF